MKRLMILFFVLGAFVSAEWAAAQVHPWPQYYYKVIRSQSGSCNFFGLADKGGYVKWDLNWGKIPGYGDSTKPFPGLRYQVWYPKDTSISFTDSAGKAPPEGMITAVYLKIVRPYDYDPPYVNTTYYDFKLSLGYTNRLGFHYNIPGAPLHDTFVTGMQTVYSTPKWSNNLVPYSNGEWFKFPVKAGNFYFRRDQNLVLEISAGGKAPVNTACFEIDKKDYSINSQTSIMGVNDSAYGMSMGVANITFGFDLQPTGIAASGVVQQMSLYPNPSKDHRPMLSIESGRAIGEMQVVVINCLGQEVYRQEYPALGTSFVQAIDLSKQPAGLYQVQVRSGEQSSVLRLSLE